MAGTFAEGHWYPVVDLAVIMSPEPSSPGSEGRPSALAAPTPSSPTAELRPVVQRRRSHRRTTGCQSTRHNKTLTSCGLRDAK